ncbi:hypothetical protein [Streptomyces coerulescens]|uniref:C2H2-type domain-containing protein n=1 Tax=Streptomyces coerulescens TaxID=29304 RepID=A0ABW0CPK8_STRCD
MSSTNTPGPNEGPLSDIEVRVPCQYCPPPAMVPRTLFSLHMASEHPEKIHHHDPKQQLAEAGDALYAIGRACLVVKGTLEAPYPDDPRWSPWTRFVSGPARTAYNLGFLLRRRYSKTPGSRAHLGTTALTRLYNAARTLADQTIGHDQACEWHTNSHSFCSCQTYSAACAGVDAALAALDNDSEKEG